MQQPKWRYKPQRSVALLVACSRNLAESVVVPTAVLGSESVEMSMTRDLITRGWMAFVSAMLLRATLRENQF